MLNDETKTKKKKLLPQEEAACINYITDYFVTGRQLYSMKNTVELAGFLSAEIKEKFNLNLTNKQINQFITIAYDRISEFVKRDILQKEVWYVSNLMDLLERIRKAGDYKSELPVLKEIAAVVSVYPDKNDRELQFKALFESTAKDNLSDEQKMRLKSGEEPVKVFANA